MKYKPSSKGINFGKHTCLFGKIILSSNRFQYYSKTKITLYCIILKPSIESGEININEAAKIVGYKSPNSFSRAFKEYFGILPKELKKEKKIYL